MADAGSFRLQAEIVPSMGVADWRAAELVD
jgi:hypothetical protein